MTMRMLKIGLFLFLLAGILQSSPLIAQQVTSQRILNAASEPQNWLTYGGTLAEQRYSTLATVTPANVNQLQLKWVYRPVGNEKMEATPLVVDGVLYTVHADEVVALDAATGRRFWTFRHTIPAGSNLYLNIARGLGIHGNTVIWPTIDGFLIAIDASNGKVVWERHVFDWKKGLNFTMAPLIVKDKILLGSATSEYGTNCWVAAFDVRDGKELWRTYTIPNSPTDPGVETWSGESWKYGGSPIWITGAYDPGTNLSYWGTGDPNPGWNGDLRLGDNLFSDSVVALDADTGKMKWYYQFTPHDEYDWDSVEVPVLATIPWQGTPQKLILWANRNGFFYLISPATGKVLLAKAFVKQNWNIGFDKNNNWKPVWNPKLQPRPHTPESVYQLPGTQGGTNWYSPSYSPHTGLFYVSTWDNYGAMATKGDAPKVPPRLENGDVIKGQRFDGIYRGGAGARGGRGVAAEFRTEDEGYGAVRAIDPLTGEKKWDFKMVAYTEAGILTTVTDLLFSGGMDGDFFALDARTGKPLWKVGLGGSITNGPITYSVRGKQYVAIAAQGVLYAFGLPD